LRGITFSFDYFMNKYNKQPQKHSIKESFLAPTDSLLLKGLAICAMLWHHLFYTHSEYGTFIYQTAQLGKVCVAIFLFVSGYGVAHQYCSSEKFHVSAFLWHRLVKFYINYWVIFLIVIPVGILFYGRTLTVAYGGHPYLHLFIDFWGMGGGRSYNMTWWFNSLIIELYILSSLLFYGYKHAKWVVLGMAFFLQFIPIPSFISNIGTYLFSFLIGIALRMESFKVSLWLKKINFLFLIFPFIILLILRQTNYISFLHGITCDAWISLILGIMVAKGYLTKIRFISSLFSFLGKHSINIYLVHTFIVWYYYKDLTYSFSNPLVIFLFVLAFSLSFSLIVEKGKMLLGINKLIHQLINIKYDSI